MASEHGRLDIRGVVCPMTWVQTSMRLATMATGEHLTVFVDEGDPMRNLPRSVKEAGHRITEVSREGDDYVVTIEKG